MYSRSYTLLFALLAFATFAFAKPVPETVHHNKTGLELCLEILLDLKVQIFAIIDEIHAAIAAEVNVDVDVSVFIYEIIDCIKVAITACLSLGVIVNLKDLVTIKACAEVLAEIFIAIQGCLSVVAHISANVQACLALDACLQVLLLTVNTCVANILDIVAKLCVNVSVNASLDIVLSLCASLLRLNL